MLRKFVGECVSAQSPSPPVVLALLPGRSWRKYGSTIKLWLFEQNPFWLSSALIICSMDFCLQYHFPLLFCMTYLFTVRTALLYIYSY